MQRQPITPIDSSLAARNQGQLVSQAVTLTRPVRVPGLVPVPPANGRAKPIGRGDLAGVGAFSIEVPFFGTLDWKQLALGALVGAGILMWRARSKRATKARAASMAAKISDA